jgi:ribonucleotide reductase beta subunit family protein with ferritin-like domain
MYKSAVASFWTVEEVNLSSDLEYWDKLNDDEKYYIEMVLAFFSSSDSIVMENIVTNFYTEIKL